MHGIHGRAPALATGLAAARADLSIWVVTGDGDALSIGGNHLIHALRRNVPIKILLFNNQIYGLTKGQASPTSRAGQGHQVDAVRLAATRRSTRSRWRSARRRRSSRARSTRDAQHLTGVLRAAAEHEGAAFVEIYQNCPVFNDGAFDALRDKGQARLNRDPRSCTASRSASGADGEHGRRARRRRRRCRSSTPATRRRRSSSTTPTATTRPSRSRSPASPTRPNEPTPIGVFRAVERPVGITEAGRKIADARSRLAPGALADLLQGSDTWTVGLNCGWVGLRGGLAAAHLHRLTSYSA